MTQQQQQNNNNITIGKNGRIYKKGKEAHGYKPHLIQHKGIKVKCVCGCGELIDKYDYKGTEHRFKVGHHYDWLHEHVKGKPQPLRTKDEDLTCKRERFRRARWYFQHRDHKKEKCIVYDRQICRGRLGIFFVDGNDYNFESDNIAKMCISHRQIMATNHIEDYNELKELKAHFYIERKTGKRRWMIPGKNRHK